MNKRLQQWLALAMVPVLFSGGLTACQRAGEDRGTSSGTSSGGKSQSGRGESSGMSDSGSSSGGTSSSGSSKSSEGSK